MILYCESDEFGTAFNKTCDIVHEKYTCAGFHV